MTRSHIRKAPARVPSRLTMIGQQLWSAVTSPRVALHALLLGGGAIALTELLPRLGLAVTSEWSAAAFLFVAGLSSIVHHAWREPQDVRPPRWTIWPAFAAGLALAYGALGTIGGSPDLAAWVDLRPATLDAARRLIKFSTIFFVVESVFSYSRERWFSASVEEMEARPQWLSLKRPPDVRARRGARGK